MAPIKLWMDGLRRLAGLCGLLSLLTGVFAVLPGCGGGGGGGGRAASPGTPSNPATPGAPRVDDTTPPPVPQGLSALTSSQGVELAWQAVSASDLKGYYVYQTSPSLTRLSSLQSATRFTPPLSATPGDYFFAVSAVDQAGNESARSTAVKVTVKAPQDTTPPPVPGGLSLNFSGTTGGYFLTWQEVAADDLSGYVVHQRIGGGELTTLTGTLTTTTFNLGNLLAGSYQFYVSSRDTSGNESELSAPLSRVIDPPVQNNTDAAPPPSPTGLNLTETGQGLLLTWDPVAGDDVAGYRVWRSVGGSLPVPLSGVLTPTSFLLGNLTVQGVYAFYVSALDTAGNESQRSIPVAYTVTPPPPVIETPPPAVDVTPPPVPTGLQGNAGDGQAGLSWQPVADDALAGYLVYQSVNILEDPVKLTPGPVSASQYSVTGLSNGTTYYYSVSSVDAAGNESEATSPIPLTPTAPDTAPPAAPTGLTAIAGDATVRLAWTNPSNADFKEIRVYWRQVSASATLELLRTEQTPATLVDIAPLQNFVEYAFTVSARDVVGNESAQTTEVRVTPMPPPVVDATPPQTPAGLQGTALDGEVALSWLASPDPDLAGYRVYSTAAADFSNPALVTHHTQGGLHQTLQFTVTGLANGVALRFSVSAVDATGNESPLATPITLTPTAPPASSWPGFLNSAQHHGHGDFVGTPNFNLVWEEDTGADMVSAPVIATRPVDSADPAYQIVLFGGNDQTLHARSLRTGAVIWNKAVGHWVGATPLYLAQQDVVIVASYGGLVRCLEAATGNEIWKFGVPTNIVSSPVSDGQRVYFGAFDGKVYALNLTTGAQVWSHNATGQIWSSPALSADNATLYIGTTVSNPGGDLRALNTSDGSLKWKFFVGNKVLSSPVLDGGRVYFGAYTQKLYILSEADGALINTFNANGAIDSSPLVTDDAIYFGTGSYPLGTTGHTLYALNKSDLSVRWLDEKTRYDADLDLNLFGIVEASPVLAGNQVCVGAWDYTFACHHVQTGVISYELVTTREIHAPAAVAAGYMVFNGRDGRVRIYSLD